MNLQQRSYQPELLDDLDIPFEDIKRNMQELNFINTYLGGHQISIRGLKQFTANKNEINVCEIGCGGGDNLLALLHFCNKENVQVHFTGIDIKPACIEFAKNSAALQNNTTWITNDYKAVRFDKKPDVIFSSLFCHHFTDEALAAQLIWMKENSNDGFFINDLQRSAVAYFLIKSLSAVFSKSYLVKNDAPLSVARSFVKRDWKNIFSNANIHPYNIGWEWAFRYLIIYKNNAGSSF
jgi:2-polyprenyl-3-methyl-5-hydroxy-6-metoxy-1,4-benzoquinol methylase